MIPLELPSYTIVVPPFWEVDWEAELETAGESERVIVTRLQAASELLRDWDVQSASPSRLAWITLWTHVFCCLQGTRGALRAKSSFTMTLLERAALETALIGQLIMFPASQLAERASAKHSAMKVAPSAHERAWAESRTRLEAYCAWCLAADVELVEHLLQKKNLAGAWDPEPALSLAADPAQKAFHEMLFGPLPTPDKAELTEGRATKERELRGDLVMIRRWLEQPILTPWHKQIEGFRRENGSLPSFFALFDPTERSVNDRLRNHTVDMGFAYSEYKRASQLIHGSTILNHVSVTSEKSIMPTPSAIGDSVDALAKMVDVCCTQVLTQLYFLKPHLD